MNEGLNKACAQIHKQNKEKGFYDDKRQIGTLLMLMVSELSEAMEADRKGKYADMEEFESLKDLDTGLPRKLIDQDELFKDRFERCIKDTYEDEIADTFIRLMDHVGYLEIDIEKHIELKLKYNSLRPHKQGKGY